jgi:putative lipoprotein
MAGSVASEDPVMRTAAWCPLMLALTMMALGACGQSEVPTTPRPTPQSPAPVAEEAPPRDIEAVIDRAGAFSFEAYAYDCEGLEVVVRPGDRELKVTFAETSMTLPQVEAASGARYADGGHEFWVRGADSAVLSLDGEESECELDRSETPWVDARARGAKFRGFGQEPGWHLEIHPERIVMVYQYGERNVVVPNLGAAADPDNPVRRWHATTETNDLQVTVEDRACSDVMSGDVFAAKVSVVLDGRNYEGCGRDLE